jgi:2-polyprenyl-3-methyl-5-hydroxy-6-metoxy-1,4-benzoquinol methylase
MNKDQVQEFARLWGGFREARVVLTANNLGVFESLGGGRSAPDLAKILQTDPRATEVLLDAVTALGLLDKRGSRYRLTAMAKRFLLPKSPAYQGDMLRHADTLWSNWSGLDDVVRTGRPNRSGSRRHDMFIRAMHNNAVLRAGEVIGALDLRRVGKALDLGGGPGTYSIELARRGIAVTLFDLPNTVEVAQEVIRRSGAKNITFRFGDFHDDDIGRDYDLVLISQVLHSHGPGENIALLRKAFTALAARGTVAVHEFTLNENRASPVPGALFSVNMLVNTAEGRSFTRREMQEWLKKTGCTGITATSFGDTVLITGRK